MQRPADGESFRFPLPTQLAPAILRKEFFFQSQLPEEKTVVSDHIKNQDLNDYRQAEPCVMISFS